MEIKLIATLVRATGLVNGWYFVNKCCLPKQNNTTLITIFKKNCFKLKPLNFTINFGRLN